MSYQYGTLTRQVSTWQLSRIHVSHYDSAHRHGSRRNCWHLLPCTTLTNLQAQTLKTLKTFVLLAKSSSFELFIDSSLRWVLQALIKGFARFASVARSCRPCLWSLDAWLKMAHHIIPKMLRPTRCLYPWCLRHWSVSGQTLSHNYQQTIRLWLSCRNSDVFHLHVKANFWIREVESAKHLETRNQLTRW